MKEQIGFIDNINKLLLPVVILIASIVLGGFYYASQVTKQKSIERQQQIEIEQEKEKQLNVGLKEKEIKEEKEQLLDTCIAEAERRYSDQWYAECKGQGKLTTRCISLHDMTFDEYAEQNNIPSYDEDKEKRVNAITDYIYEKEECSCRLSSYNADKIGDYRDKLKDECFKKYPQ